MEYVRFGQTGLKVSQLCLGTMSMGSSAWKGWVLDEGDSIPILRRALDVGINFFDMADWYSAGRNEEVVGRNLLKMSARERLVLATKGAGTGAALTARTVHDVYQNFYGDDVDGEIVRGVP